MAESILHPIRLRELAKQWLLEDTPSYDYAGAVVGDSPASFRILFKSNGMIAGIPFANAVFDELELKASWCKKDGHLIENPIEEVAKVSGSAKSLLLAERVVLNVLCRASGVATAANKLKKKLGNAKWQGILAGTRKTTPGFRMVEKYALLVGGADMHRYDLSSMVMLKDNHIRISGSIEKAIQAARQHCGFSQKIEVECQSLEEAIEAAEAGCDIIMLDNFGVKDLWDNAEQLKEKYPSVLIEASGGINTANIEKYACPWIDIISTSSLVQGYSTMDISMKACYPDFT